LRLSGLFYWGKKIESKTKSKKISQIIKGLSNLRLVNVFGSFLSFLFKYNSCKFLSSWCYLSIEGTKEARKILWVCEFDGFDSHLQSISDGLDRNQVVLVDWDGYGVLILIWFFHFDIIQVEGIQIDFVTHFLKYLAKEGIL